MGCSFSICVSTCVTVNYVCSLSLTGLPNYILYCSSILSLSAVSTTCEFETIDTKRENIAFPTTCLEAGDRLEIKFYSSLISDFVTLLEAYFGEFTRDTATVTVVQGISVTRYIITITTELVTHINQLWWDWRTPSTMLVVIWTKLRCVLC